MNQKKLIGILLVVILVVIGGYLVWSKKKSVSSPAQENKSAVVSINNQNQNMTGNSAVSGMGTVDNSIADQSGDVSPDEKRSDEKPDEQFRQQVMTYINQNLNKLAAAPANDKWDTPTFYFVGNSNVYLELYAVDTDLAGAKMLYKAEKDSGGAIKLTEVARYKEGEDDWILSSGTDSYANYVMEEYDLNEDTQKWEKTDEFTDQSDLNDNSSTDTNSNGSASQGKVF